MVKERFIVNPFVELALSGTDHAQLQALAKTLIMSNLEKYVLHQDEKTKGVDIRRWKLCRQRQGIKMYVERQESASSSEHMPIFRGIGCEEGKLDDLMYGLVSPTLELMRVKASYVNDFSGAAVLDSIVQPSLEDPFQALVVKWMEVDIPFASTSLVKNRDYVYIDATGFVRIKNGERLAYHLIHSVDFPKTPDLPNRIRGNMSSMAFWRQVGPNTMEFFGTAVMDPGGIMAKRIAVSTIASVFFCTLKYACCGQMKKLTFMLDKKYAESKLNGAPHKKNVCVSCLASVTGRRLGDFGKSNHTCKLCFGLVCHNCKIIHKLSFVDPDLLLSQRKVTFCTSCISEVTTMSSVDVVRAQMLAGELNFRGQKDFGTHSLVSMDGISSASLVSE
ncbi:unnamed protein product [Peronospora destructor]|uniref:FYVE-type domain-containing protein n=1 Tax=Peronospora destructor TaxID=86335 RepID=A0AAV0TN97_9STRA|nr:unnamed protein product [Peronospora destructor]